MKIGITEILKNGKREFSDRELLRYLEATLDIYPLREAYGDARVLEPYPARISSRPPNGVMFSEWVQTVINRAHELIVEQGNAMCKNYGVDALIITFGGDPRLRPYGYAWPTGYGRGAVFAANPLCPASNAHEIGHLWYLDHHYKNGRRERCIMHVPDKMLWTNEVTQFSVENQQAILKGHRENTGIRGMVKGLLK